MDYTADFLLDTTSSQPAYPNNNFEFLQALFGEHVNDAFVTGFKEDPASSTHDTRTRARMWRGQRWVDLKQPLQRSENNYFCISTFRASADPVDRGRARRRRDLHIATFVIVFDDVGVGQKVPLENIRLTPSYILQTSPGNSQYGYRLAVPERDMAKVERLINGLIATGLATGGKDPGMAGVTRFVRLPYGVNTKTKYGPLGYVCQLDNASWHPDIVYTPEQIAEAHGISLAAPQHAGPARPRLNITDEQRHNIAERTLEALDDEGLIIGEDPNAPGKWHVRCPWVDQHQERDDSGTAYFEPGYVDRTTNVVSERGGFKCHHGHCEHRHLRDVVSWLREHGHLEVTHPDVAQEFNEIVEEAQRMPREFFDQLERDPESGGLLKNHNNYELIMLHDTVISGSVRFNEFTNTIEILRKDITNLDSLVGWMLVEIERTYGVSFSEKGVRLMMHQLLDHNRYDPLHQWATGLVWDGQARLDDMLLVHAGADRQPASYVRAVTRAFMVGAANRALHPGFKFDNMLILEGAQGIGKSTMVRLLAPKPEWGAAGILDVQHKDSIADLQGKFIYEVEELQMFKRARDFDSLKAFLSRTHDRVRLAYRRDSEDYPRRAAFIGTTNMSRYLEDDEGAAQRRFWPIQVGRIDREWFAANNEQMWAEAVHAARAGELPVLGAEVHAVVEQEQLDRSHTIAEHPMYQALVRMWDNPEYVHRWPETTTTTEVLGMLGIPTERQDRAGQMLIARVLKELQYERKRTMVDGIKHWRWYLTKSALLH